MTIEAIERKCTNMSGVHIQFNSMKWCCEAMGVMFLTGGISFGDTNFDTINQTAQLRLNPPDSRTGDVGALIKHCPYCGERIVVNVTEVANES
jgi:hypothetical protein